MQVFIISTLRALILGSKGVGRKDGAGSHNWLCFRVVPPEKLGLSR